MSEIFRVLKPNGYFVLSVEFFKQFVKRDSAHPNCLLENDVYDLVKPFYGLYKRKIPWVGLREHIRGITTYDQEELLLILQKI